MAALGQRIVHALQVAVNHQHIVVLLDNLLGGILEFELFGRAGGGRGQLVLVVLLHFQVFVDYLIGVKASVGNVLIEVARLLEPQLLHRVVHHAFLELNLAVLHPALQQLAGEESVFHLRLAQCLAYLCLGATGLHNVQPVLLGRLVRRCDNLHLVA